MSRYLCKCKSSERVCPTDQDYVEHVIKLLIDTRYAQFVTEDEKRLVTLLCSGTPTQDGLDELLKIYDIEAKGGVGSMLLAYMMREHPELKFTDYETPRLKGLLDYYKFKNIKMLADFSRAAKALNRAGIYPLLLKGGAMKALRPEYARMMTDIDFLVPQERFDETMAVCKSSGFVIRANHPHSIDMITPDRKSAIDVHRFFHIDSYNGKEHLKFSPELNAALFRRSKKVAAFGAKVLIPSNEDLVFMLLVNLCKNLVCRSSLYGALFNVIDCHYLITKNIKDSNGFDWNIVFENIELTDTGLDVRIASGFITLIVPLLLPQSLYKDIELTFKEKTYCDRILLNEFVLNQIEDDCKRFKYAVLNTLGLHSPSDAPFDWSLKNILKTMKQIFRYIVYASIRRYPLCLDSYMKSIGYERYLNLAKCENARER
jgi:hypothetical protein